MPKATIIETNVRGYIVTVEVPPDRVNQEIDEVYDTLRKTLKIDGFREGHATNDAIRRRNPTAVDSMIQNLIINKTWLEAIEAHGFLVRSEDIKKVSPAEKDKPFSYTMHILAERDQRLADAGAGKDFVPKEVPIEECHATRAPQGDAK